MKEDCWTLPSKPTVDLMSLKFDMCRWPFGERPFRYCGEPKVNPFDPNCSYCAGHARLAFQGGSVSEDRGEMREAA